ncbi:site-2 protease family protein [Heliophilum fasciatum]|uniref:Zn-dependent protease n=1 Tax=Heliophilum fasciatum TaxID=35700 RepID=A0A4V2SWV1_9FIRM|nr:site-2 protease family protein [Heliophilum fasciatum]MCW2278341.1 Zn-dependent protease [Heliophilum fasciatum]TCP63786.1 Zn-dependent protease [Heliophilum fasciatum]
MFDFSVEGIVARVPAILIGLALHEYAHGKAASLLGDPTPAREGRLTINPLKHLDPIGTLMLLIAPIGWAKPVNVNPYLMRGSIKTSMMLVAAAGPAMNVLLALASAVLFYGLVGGPELELILQYMLIINLSLAVFNLLPIPPLDGSKVLAGLLPDRYGQFLGPLEQYGSLILLLAIMTGVAEWVIGPAMKLLLYGFVAPVGRAIGTLIF